MSSLKDNDDRPLPLSMLILSNAPIFPLVVTEILNKMDHRNPITPKHERFLLWGMEFIKLATIFYTLTENPSLLVPAVVYLLSSFAQALTINKIIDPERL